MLDRLLGLLGAAGGPAREPPSEQLSVALLLLELARSDFEFPEVERARIRELLAQRYGLDPAQTQALVEQAQGAGREAVSLYDYVRTLNQRLDPAAKYRVMEMLWQVAWADGRLDPNEEYLLRKLAGLLYIPEGDYIRAKLAVEDALKPPG
ncbi:MAG: TerB family tellurite resistance protein [Nevskia sp.]|nr:TerB family tellurite resistance protein [Nevskia sp.]